MLNKNNKSRIIGIRVDSNQYNLLNNRLELLNKNNKQNIKLSALIRMELFNGVKHSVKQDSRIEIYNTGIRKAMDDVSWLLKLMSSPQFDLNFDFDIKQIERLQQIQECLNHEYFIK